MSPKWQLASGCQSDTESGSVEQLAGVRLAGDHYGGRLLGGGRRVVVGELARAAVLVARRRAPLVPECAAAARVWRRGRRPERLVRVLDAHRDARHCRRQLLHFICSMQRKEKHVRYAVQILSTK